MSPEDTQNLQDQIHALSERIDALDTLKKSTGFNAIDHYPLFKVDKLYAGLPIYTAARTGTPLQGEFWLEDVSSVRKICYYISGTKYCDTVVSGGNSTGDLTGQTAAANSVVTQTTPNDSNSHTYLVGGYVNVTAISVDTVTLKVTFTDETNTSQTLSFFGEGLTTAAVSSTGIVGFPPLTIRCYPNTAITIKTTLTVGGSITYDVGGFINQLN